jgi:hypothetical protein
MVAVLVLLHSDANSSHTPKDILWAHEQFEHPFFGKYATLVDVAPLFRVSPSGTVFKFRKAIENSHHTCWADKDQRAMEWYASTMSVLLGTDDVPVVCYDACSLADRLSNCLGRFRNDFDGPSELDRHGILQKLDRVLLHLVRPSIS